MKLINHYFKSRLLSCGTIAVLLIGYAAACAINETATENANAENVMASAPLPTPTPPKLKSKKKGKGKQKPMDTQLVLVPAGDWGGQDIRLTVGAKGGTIQYPCADGQIEQPMMMDAGGNFAANGFHLQQRGGPIRADLDQLKQRVRYEGKISGETMTLKVTDVNSKALVGEYSLQHGKLTRMTRCY